MSGWEKGNQGCSVGNRFRYSAAVFKGVSNFPQSSNDFSRLPFPLMERNAFPRSVMLKKKTSTIFMLTAQNCDICCLNYATVTRTVLTAIILGFTGTQQGPGRYLCCKVTSQVWSIYLRVLSWNNGAEQYWRTEMTSMPTDIGIIYNRTSVDATNLF